MGMWTKRRTTRYFWRSLVVATVIACVILVYISFSVGTKNGFFSLRGSKDHTFSAEKQTEEKCIPVCDSKECIYQTKMLIDNLKLNTNPCENFHEFTCGNLFEKRHPEEAYDFAMLFKDTMEVKLKSILDTIEAGPDSASGKMKIVYDSCMKYSSSDFRAISTILQFLHNAGIPNWPNLPDDFKFNSTSFTRVLTNLLLHQEYGFIKYEMKYAFMELRDGETKINASIEDIKSAYEKPEKSWQRRYLVNNVLKYFNMDPEIIERIWEESEAIHDAIKTLREENMKLNEEDKVPFSTSLNCIENLESKQEELCGILDYIIEDSEASDKINKDFASITHSVYFVENIFSVLHTFSERSIANYLALNVIFNNIDQLNLYFRLSWKKANTGIEENLESVGKWEKCVKWISEQMALALGYEYLKKDLTLEAVEEVKSLTEECIRETAEAAFRQEWMPEDIREQIKGRVSRFTTNLKKFIKVLPNETTVNWFYNQFHPTQDDFLHNVLEYKKMFYIMEVRGLFTVENTDWLKTMFLPSAGGGGGGIDIELGILLPPTYSPGLQRAMNLVSLGIVIIHEIGHNLQLVFKYRLEDDPKANDYYKEKYKCLEDQYSQFRFESLGKNLNGSQYAKENFADIIAIAVVDKIIEKYSSDDHSFLLPSLAFSMKQQLYLRSVQMWCTVHTPKNDEVFFHFDSHSPERFRILGMMQNSRGFSEAFGCEEDSYMNPSTKCTILD